MNFSKALGLTAFSAFFLECEDAFSSDYKWRAKYSMTFGSYDSPNQACKNMERDVAANAGTNTKAVFVYPERDTENSYLCYYQIYSWQSTSKTWIAQGEPRSYIGWHAVAIREGRGCSPGKIENADQSNGSCSFPKGYPTGNSCNGLVGNPINIASGNKLQRELDFTSEDSSFQFFRSYNSTDGIWRHNYSTRLIFLSSSKIALIFDDGRESLFTASSNNVSGTTITPTSADLGLLSKAGTTGWQYVSTDNERFTFDTAGKLTQWSNAHGAVHQLAYSGSQVTVADNFGNSLSFTKDTDHQPLTLTAPGVQITYGYNSNKRLTSVTRVAGGQTTQRQFHYEDPRNSSWLTGITDERGVRYATWSYDGKGRAISSEHAEGADKVTVAYNADGTASVTNELGKVAKYSFQYIKGVNRIASIQGEPSANCPNSNSTFTYDSRGLLTSKTDNKGHVTTFDYNERGLEISRTEAYGTAEARTITTEWHPTLFLPAVVTEPNRIIRYHYDAQGRQLSRTVDAL